MGSKPDTSAFDAAQAESDKMAADLKKKQEEEELLAQKERVAGARASAGGSSSSSFGQSNLLGG